MDTLSTTPDLPAYIADLAARVERLEQPSRSQQHREHMHASVSGYQHSHPIAVGQHTHMVSTNAYTPEVGQHTHVVSAYMQ